MEKTGNILQHWYADIHPICCMTLEPDSVGPYNVLVFELWLTETGLIRSVYHHVLVVFPHLFTQNLSFTDDLVQQPLVFILISTKKYQNIVWFCQHLYFAQTGCTKSPKVRYCVNTVKSRVRITVIVIANLTEYNDNTGTIWYHSAFQAHHKETPYLFTAP